MRDRASAYKVEKRQIHPDSVRRLSRYEDQLQDLDSCHLESPKEAL